jgi:hypothetical protein
MADAFYSSGEITIMQELLAKLDGGQIVCLALAALTALVLTAAAVAVQWRLAGQARLLAALTAQMLEQEMSADQIAQVLQAARAGVAASCGPPQPEAPVRIVVAPTALPPVILPPSQKDADQGSLFPGPPPVWAGSRWRTEERLAEAGPLVPTTWA